MYYMLLLFVTGYLLWFNKTFKSSSPPSLCVWEFCYSSVKFLGVFLDDKLAWTDHIDHVKSKIAKSLYIINRSKRYMGAENLRTLYYSMIHCYLNYGIVLWGSANKCHLNKVIVLQKKAIRIVTRSSYNAPSTPLFRSTGIFSVHDMYYFEILKLMFDVINLRAPPALAAAYTITTDIHHHNTRQAGNLHIRERRTHSASVSILHSGPRLWSTIPHNMRNLPSKKQFIFYIKSHIKSFTWHAKSN